MSSQTELRQRITDEIVAALTAGGLPPWRRPWAGGPTFPANATTDRRYSGVNVLLLQMHQRRHGLASNRYATFEQWKGLGCRVKARPDGVPAGRWGCGIVFCKPVGRRTAGRATDGEEGKRDEYLLLKHYTVFSADQVEGPAADRLRQDMVADGQGVADYEPAERAVAAAGADIRYGGLRAVYVRPRAGGDGDFIQMPDRTRFADTKEFYATLMHELAGHWTESRVGWAGGYAEGELRAEMAAAFAAAQLGVPQSDDLTNHQAYLASWLKAMAADPRYVFKAAADASRAVDFLLSLGRPAAEPAEVAAA